MLVSKFGNEGDLLVLAAPTTDQQDTLRQLATIQFFAVLAALILIGSLVWLFSRVAMKPIEDMIGVASAIGEGDFGARVDTHLQRHRGCAASPKHSTAMVNQLEAAFRRQGCLRVAAASLRRGRLPRAADPAHDHPRVGRPVRVRRR